MYSAPMSMVMPMMRFAGLDDNVTLPLVYTLDGPSAHSLLQKFCATKVSLEDVLS